jgi:hypothetical protein
MQTAAKVGIAVIAGGATLWLLSGTSSAGTGVSSAAAARGTTDGCAAGTKDGKAGLSESLNPSSDSDAVAAAKASGDVKAYSDAYDTAYSDCYGKAYVAPPSGGGGGTKKPVVKPPPGATGPDKALAQKAYGLGCSDGARAGYYDGYNGNSNSPVPPASGAIASGNPEAYRASFREGYAQAYFAASTFAGIAGYEPDTLGADKIIGPSMAGCAGKFEGWFAAWAPAGVHTSGRGFFASATTVRRAPPRVSFDPSRNRAKTSTSGLKPGQVRLGWPAEPR